MQRRSGITQEGVVETRLNSEQLGDQDVFDIGYGPMIPDQHVMRTGQVPVDAYYSQERFNIKRDVFRKSWLNVARAEDIPNPGDWLVQDIAIGDSSVIVVRGKDQRILPFHNMCSL